MSTVTKSSRRERKKDALRVQIVSTAIELFSARGIDDVRVEDIAEAADIGKGTIYNYFKTKERGVHRRGGATSTVEASRFCVIKTTIGCGPHGVHPVAVPPEGTPLPLHPRFSCPDVAS